MGPLVAARGADRRLVYKHRTGPRRSTATRLRIGTKDGVRDVGNGTVVHLSGAEITALARDGRDWWALTGGRTVWRSRDGGGWEEVAVVQGPPGHCLLWAGGGLMVGTAEAHLLRLVDGELEAIGSFEGVEGRDGWYTPWGGPPDTRSLAIDAEGTIFANVHVGGIPRSRDGGATWEPTIDVDADVHQVLAAEVPGAVFAACAGGLAESLDAGATWTFATDGLHATYSRAVAVAGRAVLISVSRGPRGDQAAIYRRPLNGGSFERCADGLPEWFSGNIDSHRLAASGATAALGTEDGDVFLSTDAGSTWERLAGRLPAVTCVALVEP